MTLLLIETKFFSIIEIVISLIKEHKMKKKSFISILLAILTIFLISSCELKKDNSGTPTDPTTATNFTISGKVYDVLTNIAISNAVVRVQYNESEKGTTTNSSGEYSLQLSLTADTELKLITTKAGYVRDTTTAYAILENSSLSIDDVKLMQDTSVAVIPTPGKPASIFLKTQSAASIGVKESGSPETARLLFEVQDSTGIPINIDNQVSVSFKVGAGPNGGEFISVTSALTDEFGQVELFVTSGTIAGVVQILAEFLSDNVLIRSKPVAISIHGGLPDPTHFYVVSPKVNYPALGVVGYAIDFTSYVGDKYSNPVRPNTSVYFSTSSGIIEGSGQTGSLGTTSATWLSEPNPVHSVHGAGFFQVDAKTVDENQNTITTSTIRLQSGFPILSISPTSINVANGGSQNFVVLVADVNGNPMSEGQTITISAKSEGDYELYGSTDVKIPDTQSKSWTNFSFSVYDKVDTVNVKSISIEVLTTGPNGEVKSSIFGVTR